MDTYKSGISNAILTALFLGILATLLCFVYYISYKEITGFPLSDLINVSSLIFIINILFLALGSMYYLFLWMSKKAEVIYILITVILTAAAVWAASGAHRVNDVIVNREFHQLLVGIIMIIGVIASAGIPILYHNKKFNEEVL
jgi:hypothetical protein